MDNQKHKNLNLLFKYLSRYNETNLDKVSYCLNISKTQIFPLISELQLMGLDISQYQENIKLKHPVQPYDTESLFIHTQKTIPSKEVFYKFISKSTNLEAQNNPLDCIYITDYQSQGKGRQAKKWLSPVGQSIALSISHQFNFGLQKLSGLNIAIGVSIMRTLRHFKKLNIGLKWPNDVIDSNGKVAGILIEASGNSTSSRAIIGIGLNWNIRPELFNLVDQPCSNVGITTVNRTQFICSLITNIHTTLNEFADNKLRNLKSEWNKYDKYINQNINVIQNNKIKPAIYKSINNQGLLQIEIKNKIETVASGEVSIRATNL